MIGASPVRKRAGDFFRPVRPGGKPTGETVASKLLTQLLRIGTIMV
jgi:hypothetical protein